MNNVNLRLVAVFLTAFAVFGFANSIHHSSSVAHTEDLQDPAGLDRRITSLEQRIYFIETSMRRLEQQASLNVRSTPQTNQRDVEIDLLQRQLGTLQSEIDQFRCAIVKLDERTLPSGKRASRGQDGNINTDPCRLNPETPLRLSTGP